MKGWIIINSFISSEKFKELYHLFENAAKKFNISLEIKPGDSFISPIGEHLEIPELPDFVLFWDKDIYLAKRLEELNIPLFNSSKAITLCDNKILTALTLNKLVPTPKTIIVPKTYESIGYNQFAFLEKSIKKLGFPLIIKEAYGSFGQQVHLANSFEEAKHILSKIGHKECLIQEFISSSNGRDVRINVVGGKVVASMLRYNQNDFRSNISNGGKMLKFEPSEEQKKVAIDACNAIGLTFAGVDVLFGDNDIPYICEVNSNPHFKSTLECTHVNLSEIILDHIIHTIRG